MGRHEKPQAIASDHAGSGPQRAAGSLQAEEPAGGHPMTPGELQALFLRGAEAGARTLVSILERGAQDGTIKPRDLAVVTGIMVDKVAKLAPFVGRDDEPLSLDDLARAEADAERLLAEMKSSRARTGFSS